MDAPPEKEDCKPFVDIARAFTSLDINVPQVLCEDQIQGFLLLSDLGDVQYAHALNADTADRLYADAMESLYRLQTVSKPNLDLPFYDHDMLLREMDLFREWFLGKHLGVILDERQSEAMVNTYELLATSALSQPQVWVHRDFHSRNLMYTPVLNPGVLDFQDAVIGAVTYDLVSLLRDCYIAWPRDQVKAWVERYRIRLFNDGLLEGVDDAQFMRWFDWMGVQRHMKAIGIFARLNHRDGKPGYLGDIPRTLSYVLQVSQDYEELRPLNYLIQETVLTRYNLQTGEAL
jgi:aminoglycoside/choline kinase family phosphotransferase